jgi:hypothetical protein
VWFDCLCFLSEIGIDHQNGSDDKDVDLGAEYWKSEHHRFEMGTHAQALCDLDPLSYHQVGLAVPGTFIHDGELITDALVLLNFVQRFSYILHWNSKSL